MYNCQYIFKYFRIKSVISRYNKHHKKQLTLNIQEFLYSDCKTLQKLFCISIPCASGVYDVNENNQDFNENIVVVVHLMQITRKICSLACLASTVKPVYNGHPWDLKNVVVMQRAV
jgi:hypothetical protein